MNIARTSHTQPKTRKQEIQEKVHEQEVTKTDPCKLFQARPLILNQCNKVHWVVIQMSSTTASMPQPPNF